MSHGKFSLKTRNDFPGWFSIHASSLRIMRICRWNWEAAKTGAFNGLTLGDSILLIQFICVIFDWHPISMNYLQILNSRVLLFVDQHCPHGSHHGAGNKKKTQFSVKRKRNHLLTREAHSAPIDKEHSLKFSAKISFLLFNIKFILQWFARWSRPGTNCSVEPGGTNRAGDHSGTTAALKGSLYPCRHIWKTLNRMAEESRAGQSTLIIVPNQLWSSPTLDPPESVSANWQNQTINFQITTSCTWGGRAWKASAGLNMSEMHFMISPRCGERGGRHSING